MSMHLSELGCYLLPNNTPQVGCIARLDEDTASLICRDQISTCMPKKDTWVNIENYMIKSICVYQSNYIFHSVKPRQEKTKKSIPQ
jgi:hypothetical protein